MSPNPRRPLIAGNWKMHKTVAEAEAFVAALLPLVSSAEGADVGVCAPFTALGALVDSTRGSRLAVFAQNMHEAPSGAFTGEVSAPMLTELDIHGVVLGHSERREHFGETDRALALKVPAALEAGLEPILCVGETEDERERGDTQRKLRQQVQEGLAKLPDARRGGRSGRVKSPPRSRRSRPMPTSGPGWRNFTAIRSPVRFLSSTEGP